MLFFICFLLVSVAWAEQHYYLCGPDEDGCFASYYYACLCMPYDEGLADQPYCLSFDNVSCSPLSKVKKCDLGLIFKDQGTCLAVAFQSEPEPPCLLTTETFCRNHHIALCDRDGGQATCR